MESIDILNIPVLAVTERELLDRLSSGVLVTPNVDHLVKLQADREFYDVYRRADWVVCDSRILSLCSRALPASIPEAIPGSSFFGSYYMHHKDDPDCRIFLLGARPGVADEAMRRINARVGRDIVVGATLRRSDLRKTKRSVAPSPGLSTAPEPMWCSWGLARPSRRSG